MDELIGKVIVFKDTRDSEYYFDEGMKALVTDVSDDGDIVQLCLDFSEFEEYNKQFMISDWLTDSDMITVKWCDTSEYPKDGKTNEYFLIEDVIKRKYFDIVD